MHKGGWGTGGGEGAVRGGGWRIRDRQRKKMLGEEVIVSKDGRKERGKNVDKGDIM